MKVALRRTLAGLTALAFILYGCNTVIIPSDGGGPPTGDNDNSNVPPGSIGDDLPGADDVELPAEPTKSFFTAFQIDPVEEDTAGAKFVVAGDVDQDGLLDLVSAWNQSQPVQLHLQRRDPAGNISFRTISLGGTTPIAIVAGLQLGNINGDAYPDVVVLSKATGFETFCPKNPPSEISNLDGELIVLFNPANAALIPDGDNWTEMIIVNPYIGDRWIHDQFPGIEFRGFEEGKTKPEWNGFTDLVVANMDGNDGDEILVTLNPGECEELGQDPPANTVDLWINPGPALAETSAAWGINTGDGFTRGAPITLMLDAPQVKDIEVMDVDSDGDLDVVATYTNAISQNIRWVRNPLTEGGYAAVVAGASGPGVNACDGGLNDDGFCDSDSDCVGVTDGVCLGGICSGGRFPGAVCEDSLGCEGVEDGRCAYGTWRYLQSLWEIRPVGQVDSGADVFAVGDVDNDGSDDILVRSTIGQVVQWFRRPNTLVVAPEFPPNDPLPDRLNFPWQVFTMTEFNEQEPEALSIGDITGDGINEVMVAVGGGVFWYDSTVGDTTYDPWFPNPIIQDQPDANAGTADQGAPGSGVGVGEVDESTHINKLLVVDLDADGRNDIVGTLDRRSGSGLSDDRLVWYRNVRTEEENP